MSSAAHLGRAKEQIACKVFTQCIKHTAAQSKLSVPLFFSFVIDSAWKKEPGHSKQRQSRGSPSYLTKYFHRNLLHLHGRRPRKQVHTVEMTVPNPPKKDILLPQSLCMRDATPVVNMSRTNIHYDCKKQRPRRRSKTTPLQILDHAPPCLPLWQSPMHCAVGYILTYALRTGITHIFAKLSAVEQCVRHSKELHRLYDRGT